MKTSSSHLRVFHGDGRRVSTAGGGAGRSDGTGALAALPDDERRRWPLSRLYAECFAPLRVQGTLHELTHDDYEKAVAWWVKLTGDPPLEDITRVTCQNFVRALAGQPGRRLDADGRREPLAVRTVRKHGANINRILAIAGPWSKEVPDGQDILGRVPFCLLPAAESDPPHGDFSIEEMHRLYIAAARMVSPRCSARPCWWWRGVLVIGYYTGLRRGALLHLRRSWLEVRDGLTWVAVPGRASKKGKGKRQWVHPAALEHLAKLTDDAPPGTDRVFPTGRSIRSLGIRFDTLLALADVPAGGRQFQGLRKTHTTQLAALDLQRDAIERARQSAGHATADVTAKHYVSLTAQEKNLVRAIMALPSPVPPEAPDERQKLLF